MRFRRADWDVAMPAPLISYWQAWNEADLDRTAAQLAEGVTDDVVWNDPRDSFVGIGELEAAVHRLRTSKPEYRFVIASEIDHHNDRLRYRWDMRRGDRTLMEGLDIVTLDPSTGLICRVDGFFGHPTPIDPDASAICAEPGAGADQADLSGGFSVEPVEEDDRYDRQDHDQCEDDEPGHSLPLRAGRNSAQKAFQYAILSAAR